MPGILELRNVRRVYGQGTATVTAVDGITFTVEPGEMVAVMGPSGSGKTTLIALAGGLETPTSGEVEVEGVRVDSLDLAARAALRRRAVGYVFQHLNLLPTLTAAENVALPRELDGLRSRAARIEAVDALAALGLEGLADRFPDDLSGGEQQRIAIARALVGDRRVLLADEPTGALDTTAGEAVLRLLRNRADAGAAVVLVTHEPAYAGWADRVVRLRDGRVVDETRAAAAVSGSAVGAEQ